MRGGSLGDDAAKTAAPDAEDGGGAEDAGGADPIDAAASAGPTGEQAAGGVLADAEKNEAGAEQAGGEVAKQPAVADPTVELVDRPETTVREAEAPEPTVVVAPQAPATGNAGERTDAGGPGSPYETAAVPGPPPGPRFQPPPYDPASDPWSGQVPVEPAPAEPQQDSSAGGYGTGSVPMTAVKGGWDGVRRRRRRQTLTFLAGFFAVLLVGFLAWLTYEGALPWPFGGKVNTAQSTCTRSKPLPPKAITLRVYNGSTRNGLAGRVADQLKAFGFKIQDTGNDPLEARLRTPIELRHGDTGQLAARTMTAYLVGKVRDVRDDRLADTVDVVLGPSFARVHTRREVTRALATLTPTLPLTCPAGTTPPASVKP